jgi:hypothetical protein
VRTEGKNAVRNRDARLAGLLVTGLLLAGCQGDDTTDVAGSPTPAGPGATPGVTETVTPAPTPEPTLTQPPPTTAEPTPTGTPPPTTPTEDAQRDLLVTPQEPVTVAVGSDAEFAFAGRLGEFEAPPPDLVGFGWLPCETVDATRSGSLRFPDNDGDGHADQMGTSNTGGARLFTVNGERYENVDDEWPVALHTTDQQPPLELAVRSSSPDCATLVFFLDDDGDEQLDLAEDATPVEVYGVAEAGWEE